MFSPHLSSPFRSVTKFPFSYLQEDAYKLNLLIEFSSVIPTSIDLDFLSTFLLPLLAFEKASLFLCAFSIVLDNYTIMLHTTMLRATAKSISLIPLEVVFEWRLNCKAPLKSPRTILGSSSYSSAGA